MNHKRNTYKFEQIIYQVYENGSEYIDGRNFMELTDECSWPEIVDRFEDFLRGCGFVLNGHLELVTDETNESSEEE